MSLRFSKMHGLGNDFMVIDLVTQRATFDTSTIQRWSDRSTGIGFDQLLVLEPPTDPEADFTYRIWNADGTEVEQCGNGVRCVARFATRAGLTQKTTLVLQSQAGLLTTKLLDDGNVDVDMGVPSTDPTTLPFATEQKPQHSYLLQIDGQHEPVELVPVSVGNPHAVLFVPDISTAPVTTLGPMLGQHPAFPEGVNVGFCQVVDKGFARLRVFERGVGETRACGTGACAAAVAGQVTGRLGPRVKISLPGGKLRLHWLGPGSAIRMEGPAAHVYDGTIQP